MIKDVFEAIRAAARKIFTNWGALVISFLLYAALLAALSFAVTTPEATKWNVMLGYIILPLLALVLFFTLQAIGLSYVRIGVGPGYLFKRALKDCWKLLLVSLPLILIGWLIVFLGGKVESRLLEQIYSAAQPSGRWKLIALQWAQVLLLYFVLPLVAIHLWISTVREGIGAAIKSIGRSIARAFAPRSMLIYVLVVAVFGAIAYILLFTKTPVAGGWAELWLFGARLAAALVLVFLGWLLTLGSLAELTTQRAMSELEG